MIELYPHTISFKIPPTGGLSIDENGNPVAPQQTDWTASERCRYESNGRSNIQVQRDGTVKIYAFVVFMERPVGDIAGTTARLYNSSGVLVCEGLVHHSPDYQTHSEIFIERCL